MKVRDLIEQLGKLDPSLEVYGYCEDASIATEAKPYRLFWVDGITVDHVVRSRDEDGSPSAKFDFGPDAVQLALINMSSDF
ncbi:hypothetical protein N5D77_25340 [Comamonas thiooxydans]|uniref:Uncharacterized protein n=1 Tax=Comamonas thiooxydans TaxID=363952 RepID=A0AA42TXI6_9BURK|nr:hypothetical protein [Comamonas thiooxydans]MDH1337413.1 hypothetical protein [Comamonas thiooxydans]MDH1743516.1 hypothetical protein [Comamonas thiooxydans]MDH1789890.1 hypothetical protein [Comamonas thiooxydans]